MNKGFKLNRKGVRELMRSTEMMSVCVEYANQIRDRAGTGYEVNTRVGKNRVNAEVFPATFKARQDNYENNTLLKARGI